MESASIALSETERIFNYRDRYLMLAVEIEMDCTSQNKLLVHLSTVVFCSQLLVDTYLADNVISCWDLANVDLKTAISLRRSLSRLAPSRRN